MSNRNNKQEDGVPVVAVKFGEVLGTEESKGKEPQPIKMEETIISNDHHTSSAVGETTSKPPPLQQVLTLDECLSEETTMTVSSSTALHSSSPSLQNLSSRRGTASSEVRFFF